MSEETAFLAALKANPADDITRLIYADWLDERANRRARYLRLVCSLVRRAENEILEAPESDELLAFTPIIDPDWQEAAAARFELALLEFSPLDQYSLVLALERLLFPTIPIGMARSHNQVEALVLAAPTALRSTLTYGAAAMMHRDWEASITRFHLKPRVIVRPMPNPLFSECGLFDVILRKLPWDFWPRWPSQYKQPISLLLGLASRDAANRIRSLPTVLFSAVPEAELEKTLSRVRRAFNQVGCELLPPDALTVSPHHELQPR